MGAAGKPPMTILLLCLVLIALKFNVVQAYIVWFRAIGGVVNVITAKPEQGTNKLRVMGGSNDLEQYALPTAGQNDWCQYAARKKILLVPIKMVMACARSATWQ